VTTELKFSPSFGAIELAKEQEGNGGKLLVPFLKPDVDRTSSSSPAKVAMKKSLSCTLLRPLPLGDLLGEFPSLRHVRRFKPHWKWCPVVWAMPDSGEPPLQLRCIAARCAATSPALPKSSMPWSMAEIRSSIPLRVFNPSRWSKRRRALFNEGPWTHGPVTVDTVYGPRAYSTRFLVENNAIIIENSQRWSFYKNTLNFFWNYVLVPKTLHLGP
jgi:hypothetical protein